jgi:hypothetical protein
VRRVGNKAKRAKVATKQPRHWETARSSYSTRWSPTIYHPAARARGDGGYIPYPAGANLQLVSRTPFEQPLESSIGPNGVVAIPNLQPFRSRVWYPRPQIPCSMAGIDCPRPELNAVRAKPRNHQVELEIIRGFGPAKNGQGCLQARGRRHAVVPCAKSREPTTKRRYRTTSSRR